VDLDPEFQEGRTLTLHRGAAASLVHALKYRNALYLAHDIRKLAETAEGVIEWITGTDLVPVPLHQRKLRERGYNQSRWIATLLADLAPGTTVCDCLERIRDTDSQTALSRSARRRNVKNAFAAKKEVKIDPERRHILIDDVFTTGSTLNACARALRRCGAAQISVLTLAHG
jgi:ComF family protein